MLDMVRSGWCLLLFLPASLIGPIALADEFRSPHTVGEAQTQHRRLPADDVWWTVNGKDMAWNFKNLHQIMPTVNVHRHGAVRELDQQPVAAVGDFPVTTPDGELAFRDFIASEHSTAMGVVVLHRGKIAFEAYPRMAPHEKPVYWSVSKALVGTLVRILEERGEIDAGTPIEKYLPELAGSSFSGISVRHVLDMATGLDCADEYEDKDSCYYRYSVTIGDGYRGPGAPDDPYEFAKTVEARKVAEPGHVYSYSGLNTFVLAWLVEELTGMPFQDALTQEIWWHIGAEADASYMAPVNGVPVTHGGFLARPRDVARFGLLFTPSYKVVSDHRIISEAHVNHLFEGANPNLVRGGTHNIYQWDAVSENGTIFKGGWAGQGLVINPRWDVVAVFTGYFKDDAGSEIALAPVMFQMLESVFGSVEP
jgi:CubicO group peptidase (beta-lactamase class C family)